MAALGLLTAGGVAVVGYSAADRLVHPPREHDPNTPAIVGLAYANVSFVTADGLRLAGWWMPAPGGAAAPVVVFLHGYGASKVQSLNVAPFLHRAGYAVLAFDFRAHGDSQGAYTTVGIDEVSDVKAALTWLGTRPDADASRVALFGWSMGAATAINAAAHGLHVKALVLDSPFASLDAVAANLLTRTTGLPAFPLVTVSFAFAQWMTHRAISDDDPASAAADVASPLLVIEGRSDELVGRGGEAVDHAAGPNATLWIVPGAGHLTALQEEPAEYQARVLAFLGEAMRR
jgi:pimeloyl-ACP methyl ester carboxylesterase